MSRLRHDPQTGFTLVELAVVLTIVFRCSVTPVRSICRW